MFLKPKSSSFGQKGGQFRSLKVPRSLALPDVGTQMPSKTPPPHEESSGLRTQSSGDKERGRPVSLGFLTCCSQAGLGTLLGQGPNSKHCRLCVPRGPCRSSAGRHAREGSRREKRKITNYNTNEGAWLGKPRSNRSCSWTLIWTFT